MNPIEKALATAEKIIAWDEDLTRQQAIAHAREVDTEVARLHNIAYDLRSQFDRTQSDLERTQARIAKDGDYFGRETKREEQLQAERDALFFARELLGEHGLLDWTVEWDNDRELAGSSTRNTRRITLSRVMLAGRSNEVLIETIRHEVAHALTSGLHDDEWLEVLLSIGGTGAPWIDEESS